MASMKLLLILSRSLRQRGTKEQATGLTAAHEEYHQPMRERDAILLQAMIRPTANAPKGSRCMILQAESREQVDDFLERNPLTQLDALEWTLHELLPNYAPEGVRDWFKGKLPRGHGGQGRSAEPPPSESY